MTAWGALKTRLHPKALGSLLVRPLGLARKVTRSLTSAQRLRQLRISYELLHETTMLLQEQLAKWNEQSWPRHWNELHLRAERPPTPSPTEPEKGPP